MTKLDERVIELARRKEEIKRRVYDAGWSFSAIDRHNNLPSKTAQEALRNPNAQGEKAIAEILECHPAKLWPDRYDPKTKERLQPQPNYDRPATLKQRRNCALRPTPVSMEPGK